jgi:Zn-dependent membrane protease YugP
MFGIDPFYILISLPAILLGLVAQILVKSYYSKFSQIANVKRINGTDVAQKAVERYGLDIKLNVALGDLSDHYNPWKSELTLSDSVARLPSISSVGIAAHELGHVLQHKKSSFLMSIRNVLVPIVNIASTLGYFLFLLGLAINIFEAMVLGIVLFSLSTVFTIVTLPIEIDASLKAMNIIKELNLLEAYEIGGVKKVLTAAALTYVAATVQSVSTLFYYVIRAFGGRKRR